MNLDPNHIFLTSSTAVKEIMKPLQSLGINYCSWDRHYNNGGRINFCSMAEDLEHYYSNKLYTLGNTEAQPSSYQSQIVLWSTLPNQDVFEFIKQKGMGNGILIIEQYKDYCEFFGFATSSNNYHIMNTYLTHIELIKKFESYFRERAKSLIDKAERYKIVLPYHENKLPRVEPISYDLLSKSKLTQRQKSCAHLLLQGKTVKEIASSLSLSPRTIETYLDNLKLKLKCQTKTELILKLASLDQTN